MRFGIFLVLIHLCYAQSDLVALLREHDGRLHAHIDSRRSDQSSEVSETHPTPNNTLHPSKNSAQLSLERIGLQERLGLAAYEGNVAARDALIASTARLLKRRADKVAETIVSRTREFRFDGEGSVSRVGCRPARGQKEPASCHGAEVELLRDGKHSQFLMAFGADEVSGTYLRQSMDRIPMHGLVFGSAGYIAVRSPIAEEHCERSGNETDGSWSLSCHLGGRRSLYSSSAAFHGAVHEALEAGRARRMQVFVDGTRTLGRVKQLAVAVQFSGGGYETYNDDLENGETLEQHVVRVCRRSHEESVYDFERQSYGQIRKDLTFWPNLLTLSIAATGNSGRLHDAAISALSAVGVDYEDYTYVSVCYPPLNTGWVGLGHMPGYYTWLSGLTGMSVISHEHGHNAGLPHANFGDEEYEDTTDIMGDAWGPGDFHVSYKLGTHWAPPEGILRLNAQGPTEACPDCRTQATVYLWPFDAGQLPPHLVPLADAQRDGTPRLHRGNETFAQDEKLPVIGIWAGYDTDTESSAQRAMWLTTKITRETLNPDRVLMHVSDGIEATSALSVRVQDAHDNTSTVDDAGIARGDAFLLRGEMHMTGMKASFVQSMIENAAGKRSFLLFQTLTEMDAVHSGLSPPENEINSSHPLFIASDGEGVEAECGQGLLPFCSSFLIAVRASVVDAYGVSAEGLGCVGNMTCAQSLLASPELVIPAASGDASAIAVLDDIPVSIRLPSHVGAMPPQRTTLAVRRRQRGTNVFVLCTSSAESTSHLFVMLAADGQEPPYAFANFGAETPTSTSNLDHGEFVQRAASLLGKTTGTLCPDSLVPVAAVLSKRAISEVDVNFTRSVSLTSASPAGHQHDVLPSEFLSVGIRRNLGESLPWQDAQDQGISHLDDPITNPDSIQATLRVYQAPSLECDTIDIDGSGSFAGTWVRSTSLPLINSAPHYTNVAGRHLCYHSSSSYWFVAPNTLCNSYYARIQPTSTYTTSQKIDPFLFSSYSSSITDVHCICPTFHYQTTSNTCAACPANTFVDHTANTDRISLSHCVCGPGQRLSGSACIPCSGNTVKATFGNGACTSCTGTRVASANKTVCLPASSSTTSTSSVAFQPALFLDQWESPQMCDTLVITNSRTTFASYLSTNDGTYVREVGEWFGDRPVYRRTTGATKYLRAETDSSSADWIIHDEPRANTWFRYEARIKSSALHLQRINIAGPVEAVEWTTYYDYTPSSLVIKCLCASLGNSKYAPTGGLSKSNPCSCGSSSCSMVDSQPMCEFRSDCTCPRAGFSTACVDTNECSSNPCVLGGECINLPGSYRCTCPPGQGTPVAANGAHEQCEECPVGTYSTDLGECRACPYGQTTLAPGAASIQDCVCRPGLARREDAESHVPCVAPDRITIHAVGNLSRSIFPSATTTFTAIGSYAPTSLGAPSLDTLPSVADLYGWNSFPPYWTAGDVVEVADNLELGVGTSFAPLAGLAPSVVWRVVRNEFRGVDPDTDFVETDSPIERVGYIIKNDSSLSHPVLFGSMDSVIAASSLNFSTDSLPRMVSVTDKSVAPVSVYGSATVFRPLSFESDSSYVAGSTLRTSSRRPGQPRVVWSPSTADDGRRFAFITSPMAEALPASPADPDAVWSIYDPRLGNGAGGFQSVSVLHRNGSEAGSELSDWDETEVVVDAMFDGIACLHAAAQEEPCADGTTLDMACDDWLLGSDVQCTPCSACDGDAYYESACSAVADTACLMDQNTSTVPGLCSDDSDCPTEAPNCRSLPNPLGSVCVTDNQLSTSYFASSLVVEWPADSDRIAPGPTEWTVARARVVERALEWSIRARTGSWIQPHVHVVAVHQLSQGYDHLYHVGGDLAASVVVLVQGVFRGSMSDSAEMTELVRQALVTAIADPSPWSSLISISRILADDLPFFTRISNFVGPALDPRGFVVDALNPEKSFIVQPSVTSDLVLVDALTGTEHTIYNALPPSSSPTPTPSITPTPTNTPTPSNTPSNTPTPTPTSTISASSTPTAIPSTTSTATATSSNTPSVTPQVPSTSPTPSTSTLPPSSSPSTGASASPTPSNSPSKAPSPSPTQSVVQVNLCNIEVNIDPSTISEADLASLSSKFITGTGASYVRVIVANQTVGSTLCLSSSGSASSRRRGRRLAAVTVVDAEFKFVGAKSKQRTTLQSNVTSFATNRMQTSIRSIGGKFALVSVDTSKSSTSSTYTAPDDPSTDDDDAVTDDDDGTTDKPPALNLSTEVILAIIFGALFLIVVVGVMFVCVRRPKRRRRRVSIGEPPADVVHQHDPSVV